MTLTIDQALSQAIEAHRSSRLEEAEGLYRAILQAQPAHPDAHHNLGILTLRLGKPEAALLHLKAALDANPAHGQFWISYVSALIETRRFDEAAGVLEAGRRGALPAEAAGTLERRLAEKRQAPPQEDIDALLSSYSAGDLDRANLLAASLAERFPRHAFAWKAWGAIAQRLGRPEDALVRKQKAVELDPQDAEAHSNLGATLSELGRLVEAEASYREAVRLRPTYAEAYSNLGVTLMQLARWSEAEACCREAIRLNPDLADAYGNLGNTLRGLGRIDEAVGAYEAAIRLRPDFVMAHSNLAITLGELGRQAEAETAYRAAIRLKPDDAVVHSNLGATLKDLGRLAEAEASYREAIRLQPDYADAHANLGVVLGDVGRLAEAEASLRKAIRLRPGHALAHNNLGALLKDRGQIDEAEASYREALRHDPGYALAHNNLGVLLGEVGRLEEAETHYREAVRLAPGLVAGHSNLGNVLRDLGRFKAAEASCREALRLRPNHAPAHSNLGNVLGDMGRLEEAQAHYREALRLNPDDAQTHSNLLFDLNYMQAQSPSSALAEARRYGERVSARAEPKFTSWAVDPEPARLRVGLVSGDLRTHPVGYFVEGLVRDLDPARFELVGFPTTPKADDLTARIRAHVAPWAPIYGQDDLEAARTIHRHGVHVLIDLSGHTAGNRLPMFAYRPAPVQASWLGYFATTGLPEMDYVIGDPQMAPDGEDPPFTERLWTLPDTWLCLTPPAQSAPVEPLPALAAGHLAFGSFGNLAKMNEAVVALWARVLRAVPGSTLALKSRQLAETEVADDVRRRFADHGVAAERLLLEGPSARADYLKAHGRIDMVLDTFPYPGGTTSVDALWMGVPVLTLRGDRFLARLGQSIAHNAGLDDWIARDADDYVDKAVRFAADLDGLARLRSGLREQVLRSPLFDTQRFALGFGEALWGMWRDRRLAR